ncbi:dNTP triphosphohydrolase [Roseibium polysiphoniae]|uniref:DNTP triphosphohydrolase n=1 Tax=Roseibium polysiphoniae TaxID=2571221 RepID=A0A944CCB2_9HYPH|nr:dNTP triphosphohydrolase [Roseibium polysiphoniae]MBS8259812.1 dNTP triphosphohydrolase [Roseibium polysiphoniae]
MEDWIAARADRRHSATTDDQRSAFQRDRDRILYSSAFQRLDGITQIVRAGEADVFHNRLTHTLKVAQVGRRLAENCLREQCDASRFHGLDVDLVEAACLGHDLGHPPFGHIGENVLNNLVSKAEIDSNPPQPRDGYEGNAQSFRIVTKLSIRHPECDGLDLTRATLAALQKYPWAKDLNNKDRTSKWGYFSTEKEDFDFCMEGRENPNQRTLEAQLMDWADDITYSVHDLEEFHRCNFIPWTRIIGTDAPDKERIITNAVAKWHNSPDDAQSRLQEAHARISGLFEGYRDIILAGRYEGTKEQRLAIRALTSSLIARYIKATEITEEANFGHGEALTIDRIYKDEVILLKQVASDYIISTPSLAAQQYGQKQILESLYGIFLEEIEARKTKVLPARFTHLAIDNEIRPERAAADCVASLTEGEALALHRRLQGSVSGSVLDPIVR